MMFVFTWLLMALLQAAPATTVRGRVVDDAGAPIVNARVAVISDAIGKPTVLTGADGRFELRVSGNAAGTRLSVSKPGYGRQQIGLTGGDLAVQLARGASVSGRVLDEAGTILMGARVSAHRAPAPADGSDPPAVAFATTDDRGDYRIGSLAPGSYVISVVTFSQPRRQEMPGGGVAVFPTLVRTYFPDALAATDAQSIALAPADERGGVDFAVSAERSANQRPGPILFTPLGVLPKVETGRQPAAITGRTVTSDGRAVAHAPVRITAGRPPSMLVGESDADGRFAFRDLPAGVFTVVAAPLVGFTPIDPNARVTLAEGETKDGIQITYVRWGAISGRVVDERGEPIQDAAVQTLEVRYVAGRRRLVPAGTPVLTDDLGRYRLFNVMPGQYVVSVDAGGVALDVPGYARAFHPATANAAQARFVSITSGSDVTGIDVGLTRAPTARVSGRLLNAAGAPTSGGNLILLPSTRSNALTFVGAGARITPDGQFEFTGVPPGQYTIQASRGRLNASSEGEFGTLPVSVNGTDVTGLTLQTSTGSAIHGRFTFDTREPQKSPAGRGLELTAVPSDADLSPSSVASADIHDDWTFDMSGVNGPRRLQLVVAPPGWMLRDVRVNGVDATDRVLTFGRREQSLTDVEVVLTDRLSELAGVVANDAGEPQAGKRVIVFPTDRSRWYPASRYLRTTASERGGAYSITGLPFGTYYAAAVATLPPEGEDAWQDPAYLERLMRGATTITIRDEQKQTTNLRLQNP